MIYKCRQELSICILPVTVAMSLPDPAALVTVHA